LHTYIYIVVVVVVVMKKQPTPNARMPSLNQRGTHCASIAIKFKNKNTGSKTVGKERRKEKKKRVSRDTATGNKDVENAIALTDRMETPRHSRSSETCVERPAQNAGCMFTYLLAVRKGDASVLRRTAPVEWVCTVCSTTPYDP
jgi:hypothetical protein